MRIGAGRLGGALVLVGALGYEFLVHLASAHDLLRPQLLVPLAGLPHAVVYSSLLWFFGRTLRSGHEALITTVAGRYHGPLPSYMEGYTRKLTGAWCVFFAAQLLGSALL